MEKNVGSVDLDELLKARQELNSERGIETDPNMYKDYNPNRKKEEAEQREGEPVMDEETAEMVADGEVPFEETVDDAEIIPEQETEEPSQVSAPEQEPEAPTDFSVYDNFAAFDVSGDEATVPEQTNTGAEPTVLSETPEPQEETPDASVAPVQPQDEQTSNLNMENFAVENESTIGNFGNGRELTAQDLAEAEALLTNTPLKKEEVETQTTSGDDENSAAEDELQKYLDELSSLIDEDSPEKPAETQEVAKTEPEPAQITEPSTASSTAENETTSAAGEEINIDDIDLSFLPDFDIDEDELAEEANDGLGEESNMDTNLDEELDDEPDLAEEQENPEVLLEEEKLQQPETSVEQISEEDKFAKNASDADTDSEQKIRDILSRLGSDKGGDADASGGFYPTIKDTEFIEIVGSETFVAQEKLAYILGRNEENNFEFSALKSMYNLAMFSNDENDIFGLVSSMMLSLMLKNTNQNLNFYLCDTKQTSLFDIFSKSSYLVRPIAKSQEDIVSLLHGVISEIDNRYESVATSGTKNIEEYNKAMSDSFFTELPYSILVFNNFQLSEYMEESKKINESLSYILKYGRLVGVYVYIISEKEIKDEAVNYNLASRISFKTETEEESIKKISISGAEKLSAADDYVLKTINMETVKHLKAPKITKREIELLIENIEG